MVVVFNRSSTIMHTVRDLQPGCVYQLFVTAENEAGESSPSLHSDPLTMPEECTCSVVFHSITRRTIVQSVTS